jgi:two-component system LytT family response regulator
MRVLIVEDEPLVRERLRTLLAAHPECVLVGESADGLDAVHAIQALRPDLALLDIQLPELDGFGVLAALPVEVRPRVIFVTAYDRHAIAAFDVNAVDYLLKPVDADRFARALDRARQRTAGPGLAPILAARDPDHAYPGRILVRTGTTTRFVDVATIRWIESRGNYLRLHLDRGRLLVRETMREFLERLDPNRFVRVHRSAAVHLDAIQAVAPHQHGEQVLSLRGGDRLRSSRTYAGALRDLLER